MDHRGGASSLRSLLDQQQAALKTLLSESRRSSGMSSRSPSPKPPTGRRSPGDNRSSSLRVEGTLGSRRPSVDRSSSLKTTLDYNSRRPSMDRLWVHSGHNENRRASSTPQSSLKMPIDLNRRVSVDRSSSLRVEHTWSRRPSVDRSASLKAPLNYRRPSKIPSIIPFQSDPLAYLYKRRRSYDLAIFEGFMTIADLIQGRKSPSLKATLDNDSRRPSTEQLWSSIDSDGRRSPRSSIRTSPNYGRETSVEKLWSPLTRSDGRRSPQTSIRTSPNHSRKPSADRSSGLRTPLEPSSRRTSIERVCSPDRPRSPRTCLKTPDVSRRPSVDRSSSLKVEYSPSRRSSVDRSSSLKTTLSADSRRSSVQQYINEVPRSASDLGRRRPSFERALNEGIMSISDFSIDGRVSPQKLGIPTVSRRPSVDRSSSLRIPVDHTTRRPSVDRTTSLKLPMDRHMKSFMDRSVSLRTPLDHTDNLGNTIERSVSLRTTLEEQFEFFSPLGGSLRSDYGGSLRFPIDRSGSLRSPMDPGEHLCSCPISRQSGSKRDRQYRGSSVKKHSKRKIEVRYGMVKVSDGKTRPSPMRLQLSVELLKLQKEEITSPQALRPTPSDSRVRIVGVSRQKVGGLGLSIKGGAEHKLPILISRIFKDQAADLTGQLFVGDAIVKVNGELITHCQHDEAVNILRNAGDIVMLTVKHYRAATPFLQKANEEEEEERGTRLDNAGAGGCEEAGVNSPPGGGWRCNGTDSLDSRTSNTGSSARWLDIITVPLMMAYVTRYIFGTDKLRPNAFEVRGLNGSSTGVVHCDDAGVLSQWLKHITDNIMGLTHLQMKLYNRNFPVSERIEYMGWVNEGILNNNQPWQSYRPRFLTLKGTDVLLFDSPPLNVEDWKECGLVFKVYQSMLRVIKDSENVDERQHCFLIQTSGQESRYFSVETRQELLRIESSWHTSVCQAVIKLGSKVFQVSHSGKQAGLTLDWNMGFSLHETGSGAGMVGGGRASVWQYKFSQLRGSSDDGKSRLKLHFQDPETKSIETKELECTNLQALLFCMHAFLTAKVASVDPAFLSSRTP